MQSEAIFKPFLKFLPPVRSFFIPVLTALILLLFISGNALGATSDIIRVSTDSNGDQLNAASYGSSAGSISGDGRYVVFGSYPSYQIRSDSCNCYGIFVKDTATGQIREVSTDSSDIPANDDSLSPSISADGRYIAFTSRASNLVQVNPGWGVYVKDLATGETKLVSTSAMGQTGYDFSSYYGYVTASISADGRYVAFSSKATNLVDDDTNNQADVFVKDLQTGNITRVSTDSSGLEVYGYYGWGSYRPSISADGRFVAFDSSAPSLVQEDTQEGEDVFVKDLVTGQTRLVSTPSCHEVNDPEAIGGTSTLCGTHSGTRPSISSDGGYIAFASTSPDLIVGDTNGALDTFVKDMTTGVIQRVSTGSYGSEGFGTWGSMSSPSISGDGRFVAFYSEFNYLVSDDTNNKADVFIKDTHTDQTISVSTSSADVDSAVSGPAISQDGHYVAFSSNDSNLVPDDTNNNSDVFRAIIDIPPVPGPTCEILGTGMVPGDIVITADLGGGLLGAGAYAIIPGFWKHVGMYVGNGKVVEAISSGVEVTPLSNWVNDKKWVDYLHVNTDQPTQEKAVTFALTQAGYNRDAGGTIYLNGRGKKRYEWWLVAKNSDPNLAAWYCSELVWAAYINASNNHIDLSDASMAKIATLPFSWQTYLLGNRKAPDMYVGITPTDVRNSSHLTKIGGHHDSKPPQWLFTLNTDCPVDIQVTDPQGRITNINDNSIPGATYGRDIDESGRVRSWVGIPGREQGDYQITVIPWYVAEPSDTYSVRVSMENNSETILADDVSLGAANSYTYTFNSQPFDMPLSIQQSRSYWFSYADYLARILSVDMTISNNGTNNAFGVQVNDSLNTNGVIFVSTIPVPFGDISAGNQNTATIKYEVPAGVSTFRSTIYASANDPGGFSHSYP